MKRKQFFQSLLIASFIMLSIQGAFADLQCSLTQNIGDIPVLRMSARTNAHSELPTQSSYPIIVYCQITNPVSAASNNCGVIKKINFIDLSSITNAHVETGEWNPFTNPGNYSTNACVGTTNIALFTFVQVMQDPTKNPTTCSTIGPGYDCIVTLSSLTNAHTAACPQDQPGGRQGDAYEFQICGYIGTSSGPPVPTDVWVSNSFNVGTQITNIPFSITGTITNLLVGDPLYGRSNPEDVTLIITNSIGATVYTGTLLAQNLELSNNILTFNNVSIATTGTYTAVISVPPAQFTYNSVLRAESIFVNNSSPPSLFSVNGTGPGQPPDDFVAVQSMTINPSAPSNLDNITIDIQIQNFAHPFPEYGNDGDGYAGVLICDGTSLILDPAINPDYVLVNFDSCNPFCVHTIDIDEAKIPVNTQYDIWAYASDAPIVNCPIPGNLGYPADAITGIPYTWGLPPLPVTENYLLNNINSQNLFIDSGGGGGGAGTGDVYVIRKIDIQGLYEGDDYQATVTFNNLEQSENSATDLALDLIDKSGTIIYSNSLLAARTDGPTIIHTIDIDETVLTANGTPLSNNNQPYTVSITIAPGIFSTLPETVLKNNLGFRAMPVLKQSQAIIIPETSEFLMIGIIGAVLSMIYIYSKKISFL